MDDLRAALQHMRRVGASALETQHLTFVITSAPLAIGAACRPHLTTHIVFPGAETRSPGLPFHGGYL
jgi:hypothetical protein